MGLLTKTVVIKPIAEAGDQSPQMETSVQMTRLIILGVLALGFGAFALVLYLNKHDGPAGTMMAVVTAILGAGFGVVVGEKSGSKDAATALAR